MKELLLIILLIALVIIVAVRRATANFKRLRMGCFFDLEARDLASPCTGDKDVAPSEDTP